MGFWGPNTLILRDYLISNLVIFFLTLFLFSNLGTLKYLISNLVLLILNLVALGHSEPGASYFSALFLLIVTFLSF